MKVSVLILTLNEEENIQRCLDSIGWCDDVVILDSFSTDKTEEVTKNSCVRFIQRNFDNYANQRNFGINEIKYKHPWLLLVDADEIVTSELAQEIHGILKKNLDGASMYRMRRKDYFLGRWIKRSSGYPTWFGRLVKIGHVQVKRAINEEYVTLGKVGLLQEHLLHYPFNKGFHAWFDKHNRYSSMEGDLLEQRRKDKQSFIDFLSSDPSIRRKILKSVVYRMPGRPLLMFLALYFIRGGFLDGKAGLTFCTLRAFYEFMIDCKVLEAKLRKENLPV